jgi:hypothetical protein
MHDTCYHIARTFYSQTGRWPTNFIELTAFAHSNVKSNPSLYIDTSHFKNVKFTPKADGSLGVSFQIRDSGFAGLTNMVFDIDRPPQ